MKKVYLLYCLSGFVSLGYQVCWFRVFVDHFGSTNLTFALVLCNFIGGLGLGALLSKRLTDRLEDWLGTGREQPLRVYGLLELGVTLTVCLTLLLRFVPADLWGTFPYTLDADGIYRQTVLYQGSKILAAGTCVLLPSFFMGATFPLLCYINRDDKQFPSFLYGWNTLGACSGVLACEFAFLPLLGHDRTFSLMIALNALIGMYFLVWGKLATDRPRGRGKTNLAGSASGGADNEWPLSVVFACAILSGFLCGALEGDMFKRLWFLNCTYGAAMSFISFWAILGIFLASWTVRALPRLRFWHIKVAGAVAFFCYVLVWEFAYPLRDWFTSRQLGPALDSLTEFRRQQVLEQSYLYDYRQGLSALLVQVGLFVFPAYYLLSLLLPFVCNQVQAAKRHLGMVYGLNTVAFCLGMVGFTWIAPRVNIFYSLKLMMVLFALLVVTLCAIRETRRISRLGVGFCGVGLLAGVVLTPAHFERNYFDPRTVAYQCSVGAMKSNAAHTTFVVKDSVAKWLFFDGHPMSGTHGGARRYMRLMANYPLLAHPDPKSALLICFGVGNTASAIAAHESIERIDVVDLNDKVFETAPEFAEENQNVYEDPRVSLIHDDGRNFLQLTDRTYDLVTSEPPPPMQEGVYRLYSKEYYETVNEHLTSHGMMTQWVPAWVMPAEAVDLVVSTFVQSFPHVILFVGASENYILLGCKSDFDFTTIETRFPTATQVRKNLEIVNVSEPLHLFARIIKTDEMLREEYADFPVISDKRHDLASIYNDPRKPAVVAYDPVRILRSKEFASLSDRARIDKVMMNLALLKSHVPDFPLTAMYRTIVRDGESVAYVDADWYKIQQLNSAGNAAWKAGRLAESERNFRDALSLADDQLRTLTSLAGVREQLGDFAGAIEVLTRYLVHQPEDGIAVYNRSRALVGLQRYDQALVALQDAVRLLPNEPKPAKLLGDLLATMGKKKEAIAAYDQALSIDPDHHEAHQNREKVLKSLSNEK